MPFPSHHHPGGSTLPSIFESDSGKWHAARTGGQRSPSDGAPRLERSSRLGIRGKLGSCRRNWLLDAITASLHRKHNPGRAEYTFPEGRKCAQHRRPDALVQCPDQHSTKGGEHSAQCPGKEVVLGEAIYSAM